MPAMPTHFHRLVLFGFVLCCIGCGCRKSPDGVAPVSGRVTLNGKPLAGATITFQPVVIGPSLPTVAGSVGHTDADGNFTMRLTEPDGPGAAVGKHVVTITTASMPHRDDVLPRGEKVPIAWRNGSKTFEVPAAGTAEANFELASK